MESIISIEGLIKLIQEVGSLGILSVVIIYIGFSLLRKFDVLSSRLVDLGHKFETTTRTTDEMKTSLNRIENLLSVLFNNLNIRKDTQEVTLSREEPRTNNKSEVTND